MPRDINDVLPRVPGMQWGAVMNWLPTNREAIEIVKRSPFPSDGRWHSAFRQGKDMIIDGKVIRQSDDSKLT